MKSKKADITVRELFRQKLEFAEVIPDASVKINLMRQVSRYEFLHFSSGSFNIFYLGGILLAAIGASLLIFSGSQTINSSHNVTSASKADSATYLQVEVRKPEKVLNTAATPLKNIREVKSVKEKPGESGQVKQDQAIIKKESSSPATISRSLKSGLNLKETSGKNVVRSNMGTEPFLIEPASFDGCSPLKVKFRSNIESFDSCRWTFGDGGNSNQKDPEWIFDVEGDYRIGLEIFRAGNRLTSSAIVVVHPRPKAHFEISPEKAIIPDEEVHFENYSANAVHYNWNFGDGSVSELFEPNHKYLKFANYNVGLIVFSEYGCSDSLTVYNAFSGSEYFVEFPNAFIPNEQGPSGGFYSSKSDEAAQVFHPSYSGVAEYQLKIFSKLGIPIFESSDVNLGWDGYNKGQLCEPGVYIWKVRGKFRNGEPFIRMGDVTLLKN